MALETDDYVTDGVNLLRFCGFLPDAEGVLLEDAWTCRVSTVTLQEFAAMGLNKVEREAPVAHG